MPLWLCRTSVPCEAIARRIRRTAEVGAVALVAGDDRDAGRGELRDHRAGLEQADHLAVVARRRLCHGEVDDDALQPAAVQVLDDVADPHGSLDTVTRNLPLAVNGMSSTRCRSRLASLPSRSEKHTSKIQSLMRHSYAV